MQFVSYMKERKIDIEFSFKFSPMRNIWASGFIDEFKTSSCI